MKSSNQLPSTPPTEHEMTGKSGWKGGYSDSFWLGDPSNAADRQWSSTSPGYHDEVNIAYPANDPTADIYMVPDFQGMSGQGNNQSTSRPMGSV
jgi:hypothetical protein